MKIYIAAPFFNEEQVNFVKAIEDTLFKEAIHYYSPRASGVIINMRNDEKAKIKREIFLSNIQQISKCDKMIAVIDDRDTGTIWEMGMATGIGIPVISISNKDHGLNIMLSESVQAHVKTTKDMITAIFNDSFTGELVTDVY